MANALPQLMLLVSPTSSSLREFLKNGAAARQVGHSQTQGRGSERGLLQGLGRVD